MNAERNTERPNSAARADPQSIDPKPSQGVSKLGPLAPLVTFVLIMGAIFIVTKSLLALCEWLRWLWNR